MNPPFNVTNLKWKKVLDELLFFYRLRATLKKTPQKYFSHKDGIGTLV